MRLVTLWLCVVLAPGAGWAAAPAVIGAGDPRIRITRYDPLEVTEVLGTPGFEQTLSFSSSERIQTASIGDANAWQVTPNAAGNKLFLKPLDLRAHTNLTVVTDRRTYNFELMSAPARGGASTYELRFAYPDEAPNAGVISLPSAPASTARRSPFPPDLLNLDYSFRGPGELAPLHVFDDGRFTYFQFRTNAVVPAIFAVEAGRHETLVNFHVSGKYVVVERTSAQFTLRAEHGFVCVFNHAMKTAQSDTAQ